MLQEHLLYEVFGKIIGIWCDLHFSRPVEKLAHGAQLPPKPGLFVPSGPRSTRNDCDSAIR